MGESAEDVRGTPKKSNLEEPTLKIPRDDEVSKEEKKDLEQMMHLCNLVESESQGRSRETKVNSQHNRPNGIPKRTRTINKKGVITEKMNEKALEEKLKEEASTNHVPLRDVPQYFKDYVIDEVVIVLPHT